MYRAETDTGSPEDVGIDARPAAAGIRARCVRRNFLPVLVLACFATSSPGLTFDGGPVYAGMGPVTGSCSLTVGVPCQTGGATLTCSGLNPNAFENLYFGIRNDQFVFGHNIGATGPQPTVNKFTFGSSTSTSVTYGAVTSFTECFGLSVGDDCTFTESVASQLNITFEAGTGTMVATDNSPANHFATGDIERLWRVSADSFTTNVELLAFSASHSAVAASCPNIIDPIQENPTHSDRSNIDFGFYYETSCDPTPRMGCSAPGKSVLKIRNSGLPVKNKVSWKWLKGTVVSSSDFGTPLASTGYKLCFYDGNTLLASPRPNVDGGTNWADSGNGFKYKNPDGNSKGVTRVGLRAGTSGKAKILVQAKGAASTVPTLPLGLTTNLRVQLVKDVGSGPECWETVFPVDTIYDGDTQLKARFP